LHLFDEAQEATILGEASTNYTKFPLVTDVPERIRSFNHDARFIYILRDPVERTISHYWHRVRYHAEQRSPLDAIKADTRFISVSHYAKQLEIFYACFGRDRFKVLTYEQLTRAPDETMHSLYEWLGVNPLAADKTKFTVPENVTPKVVKMAAGAGVLRRMRQLWPMRALVPHIPAPLRKAVVQIADTNVDRMSVDMSEVIAYLRPIQRRQTDELTRQLGCEFPEWTTLYSDSLK
jgi:Sulfotransferase family